MELGTTIVWLWTVVAAATNEAPADPAREQADAYVALVQADRLYEQSNYVQAAISYRDALNRYNNLSVQHPEWEADIVQYRLTYCANRMEAIFSESGRTEQQLLAEAAGVQAASGEESERVAALSQENKYLHQRLSELQDELQEQEDVENLAAEVERLKAENSRLLAREETAAPDENVPDQLARELRVADAGDKPVPLESALSRGLALERKERFEDALSAYKEVGEQDPGRAAAVRAQARCYLRLGQPDRTLVLLEKVVETAPEDEAAALLLGLALIRSGRPAEAVDILGRISSKYSASVEYRTGMGAALLGAGRYPEARIELEKALLLDPQAAAVHFNLAQVGLLSTPPDPATARSHYLKSVELGGAQDPALEEMLRE